MAVDVLLFIVVCSLAFVLLGLGILAWLYADWRSGARRRNGVSDQGQ
jgi:hypothetical protein